MRLGKVCQALSLSSEARSLGILSALLDSLDATLDARSMEQAELAHIQQFIMTALSHTSQFIPVRVNFQIMIDSVNGLIKPQTGITKQLRIDVLVKLIKGELVFQIMTTTLLTT